MKRKTTLRIKFDCHYSVKTLKKFNQYRQSKGYDKFMMRKSQLWREDDLCVFCIANGGGQGFCLVILEMSPCYEKKI